MSILKKIEAIGLCVSKTWDQRVYSSSELFISNVTVQADGSWMYSNVQEQRMTILVLVQGTTESWREASGGWVTANMYSHHLVTPKKGMTNALFYKKYLQAKSFLHE